MMLTRNLSILLLCIAAVESFSPQSYYSTQFVSTISVPLQWSIHFGFDSLVSFIYISWNNCTLYTHDLGRRQHVDVVRLSVIILSCRFCTTVYTANLCSENFQLRQSPLIPFGSFHVTTFLCTLGFTNSKRK